MIKLNQVLWSNNLELEPVEIRYADSLEEFKSKIRRWKPNTCRCRMCKSYNLNVGFLEVFE